MSNYIDCGFIYVATGKKYIDEAIYSSRTYKKHHSDISIAIFTDDVSAINAVSHVFDHVIPLQHVNYSFLDKIEMQNSPYERTIFIDTDTVCLEPVYELFELLNKCDLIVHQNAEGFDYDYSKYGLSVSMAEFNTGVLGFVTSKMARHQFFEKWRELYIQYDHLKLTDQFSFRLLLYNSDVRYCWIPSAYNFFIYFPAYTTLKAKIIHGRPFKKLEEIAEKINKVSKLRGAWQRTYYPELNEVVYDKFSFIDSWKFFKLFGALQVKIFYRYIRYGKRRVY